MTRLAGLVSPHARIFEVKLSNKRLGCIPKQREERRGILACGLGIAGLGGGEKCRLSSFRNSQQPAHRRQIFSSSYRQVLLQVGVIEEDKHRCFKIRLNLPVFVPPARSRRGACDVGRRVGSLINGGFEGATGRSEHHACTDNRKGS